MEGKQGRAVEVSADQKVSHSAQENTMEYQVRLVSGDGDELVLGLTAASDETAKEQASTIALAVAQATGRFTYAHITTLKRIQ